ncbi:hypothetical protein AB0M29_02450 [Streptomyces sp. NPDC051976]|uniref:hypothetical protein n=1 Tax=Streptomyces sp. NPDC051976 TaxID=3154947 RepID=UPI0034171CF8
MRIPWLCRSSRRDLSGRPGTSRALDGPGASRALPAALGAAASLLVLAAAPAGAIGLPWPGTGPGPDVMPPAGMNRLTVTYDSGDGRARTYTLRCGPGGMRAQATPQEPPARTGEVDAGAACGRLAELGGPVGPVAAGQMCPMIYGGPQTAHVTGVWDGERVREEYRRTDGCEVARWGRMVPVLPSPAAAPTTASAPHAPDAATPGPAA